jgi:hypothetical protein
MAKSRNDPQDLRKRAYFVDVDGTIERKLLGIEMPIDASLEGLRALKAQGALLYLWSVGGAEHARKAARDAGVSKLFEAFLPKPHVYVDDERVSAWKDCERWKPSRLRKIGKKKS